MMYYLDKLINPWEDVMVQFFAGLGIAFFIGFCLVPRDDDKRTLRLTLAGAICVCALLASLLKLFGH